MKKTISIALILFTTQFLVAQNQLLIPQALTGNTFNLNLQHGSVNFFPNVETQTMGVNGSILAPTLIFEKGETVNLYLDNQLSESTTMHWHGMHIPSEMDGGPHTVIEPNTIWNPSFTIMDRASTMWYHPHLHENTHKHVQMGMAGFIIIKDDDEASLNLPRTYGVDDIPLVFQTKTIDANYQIDTNPDHSANDDLLLTNATVDAYFNAPAQVVRFRLLNGSSERTFNIGLSNDADFYVIASDGGLLEAPVQLNRLLMSQGERYEILVDLSSQEGTSISIMNYGSSIGAGIYGAESMGGMGGATIAGYTSNPLNGADFTLLNINITEATTNPITTVPSTLVEVSTLNTNTVDANRTITMSAVNMGPNDALNGPFQLNGTPFDMDNINYEIPLNNTEIWTLTNQTQVAHPFHIHDVQFNILEIGGQAPPLHMQGWKDVVLVPPMMGTAKFITRFLDYANPDVPYMYHCHILTHEDGGMMGQFTVVDTDTNISTVENDLFSFYPNPATELIQLEFKSDSHKKIQIFDLMGKHQHSIELSESSAIIDISFLAQGLYFLNINSTTSQFIKL